jgi:hypothetical protein
LTTENGRNCNQQLIYCIKKITINKAVDATKQKEGKREKPKPEEAELELIFNNYSIRY